jgi:hypothetical protein
MDDVGRRISDDRAKLPGGQSTIRGGLAASTVLDEGISALAKTVHRNLNEAYHVPSDEVEKVGTKLGKWSLESRC